MLIWWFFLTAIGSCSASHCPLGYSCLDSYLLKRMTTPDRIIHDTTFLDITKSTVRCIKKCLLWFIWCPDQSFMYIPSKEYLAKTRMLSWWVFTDVCMCGRGMFVHVFMSTLMLPMVAQTGYERAFCFSVGALYNRGCRYQGDGGDVEHPEVREVNRSTATEEISQPRTVSSTRRHTQPWHTETAKRVSEIILKSIMRIYWELYCTEECLLSKTLGSNGVS